MRLKQLVKRRIKWIFGGKRTLGSCANRSSNYLEPYDYREGPKPRPISNVSLGEVFSWFFAKEGFLPADPNVNDVAQKCRTDPAYAGNPPRPALWSTERETGHANYSIVRLLRPSNAIEIGCYNGASSICIAQALRDNKSGGHLHCIELDEHNIMVTREHLKEAGLVDLVTLYHTNSHDESVARRLPQCEFIFVDGDHTYEGAKRDFEVYSKKLVPRGIMLYHDTTKIMELRQLMQEITDAGNFDIFAVATSDGDGITLLRPRW